MSDTFLLTKYPDHYGITNIKASNKIRGTHNDSTTLIWSFFQELSEIDKPWNQKKLDFYYKSGLITSKWVWLQAQLFVDNGVDITMPKDLPDNTIDCIDGDD